MSKSKLTTMFVVLAMVMFLGQRAMAHEDHEGKVVSVGNGKLTMTMTEDKKNREHNVRVAKDAKITVDGKEAKLEDLKQGFEVKVTIHRREAIKIESRDPKKSSQ